jgi:hypothetical protein
MSEAASSPQPGPGAPWKVTIKFREGEDRYSASVERAGELDASYAPVNRAMMLQRISRLLDPLDSLHR